MSVLKFFEAGDIERVDCCMSDFGITQGKYEVSGILAWFGKCESFSGRCVSRLAPRLSLVFLVNHEPENGLQYILRSARTCVSCYCLFSRN